jgi:hypothetical protein
MQLLDRPLAKPTRHGLSVGEFTMELKRSEQALANVTRVIIIALDPRRFGKVGNARNTIASMHKIAARLLLQTGDELGLSLPSGNEVGGLGRSAPRRLGIGAVGGEVDVGGHGVQIELCHGVVGVAVVKEDGYLDGGFEEDLI